MDKAPQGGELTQWQFWPGSSCPNQHRFRPRGRR